MNRHSRRQRGAILIFVAIAVVVLIGIGALALDLGRLFVQRTELQNAADAAALAAASELDGQDDAQDRAKKAARQLFKESLERGIYFGDFSADQDVTNFIFYSSIDPEPKTVTTLDSDARFVELTVDLSQEGEGEGIQLFFLPVLRLIPGVDAETEEGTLARALAGVENVPCYEPAMYMCVDDKNNLPIDEGEMLRARIHGQKNSAWTAGNFGFLLPSDAPSPSAGAISDYLAGAGHERCTSGAQYRSGTGQKAQQTARGFNTRFDTYKGSRTPADYPPAPNIINYPPDDVIAAAAPDDDEYRIGDGEWDRTTYFPKYHTDPLGNPTYLSLPWNTIRRWDTYLWELGVDEDGEPESSPNMPVDLSNWNTGVNPPVSTNPACDPNSTSDDDPLNDCHGEPRPTNFYCMTGDTDCSNLYDAIYPSAYNAPYNAKPPLNTKGGVPVTHASRRIMYVAALQCEDFSLNGAWTEADVDVIKESKILEFFLTQRGADPGPLDEKFEFYMEYIGPTEEGSGLTRRVIQLYE